MSNFDKKTWQDRITQYPNRREINYISEGSTSNSSIVDIYRKEGDIAYEGTAFNAENMNDLENRISSMFPVTIENGGTGTSDKKTANHNLNIPYRYTNLQEISPDFNYNTPIKTICSSMEDNTYIEYSISGSSDNPSNIYPLNYGLVRISRFNISNCLAEFTSIPSNESLTIKYICHVQTDYPFTWWRFITTKNIVELYNNSSGTNGTITLSDTYTNYDFIIIYYIDDEVNGSTEFLTSTNLVGLSLSYISNDSQSLFVHSCRLLFSGKIVTFQRNSVTDVSNGRFNIDTTASNGLFVKKIVGYKY